MVRARWWLAQLLAVHGAAGQSPSPAAPSHRQPSAAGPWASLPGPALPAPCVARLGQSVWAQDPAQREWIPRCDAHGDFEPVQCTATGRGGKRCFCVDAVSGSESPGTSATVSSAAAEPDASSCPASDEARICGVALGRHRYETHHSRVDACLARGSEAQRAWAVVQQSCTTGLRDRPEMAGMALRGGGDLGEGLGLAECRAVLCPATTAGLACAGALDRWKTALEACNPPSNFMGTLLVAQAWALACEAAPEATVADADPDAPPYSSVSLRLLVG
eukprot:COSAG06_NODE_12690_length_1342_cov_3.174578_1_plen_276_part_00